MKRSFLLISILFLLFSCEKQIEETKERDKIVGDWDVVEKEGGTTPSSTLRSTQDAYIVHITRSQTFADEVYIYNFFQHREDRFVPAYVKDRHITIDKITSDGNTYRGEGSISSDYHKITWSYWVDEGYGEEEYSAVYTFRK